MTLGSDGEKSPWVISWQNKAWGTLTVQRSCDRLLGLYWFLLFPSSMRMQLYLGEWHVAKGQSFPKLHLDIANAEWTEVKHAPHLSLDLKTLHGHLLLDCPVQVNWNRDMLVTYLCPHRWGPRQSGSLREGSWVPEWPQAAEKPTYPSWTIRWEK